MWFIWSPQIHLCMPKIKLPNILLRNELLVAIKQGNPTYVISSVWARVLLWKYKATFWLLLKHSCHRSAVLCLQSQVSKQCLEAVSTVQKPSFNGSRYGSIPWKHFLFQVLLPVWPASKPCRTKGLSVKQPKYLENTNPIQLCALKRHPADIVRKHPPATLSMKWPRNCQMRLTPQLRCFSTFTTWCKRHIKIVIRGNCV